MKNGIEVKDKLYYAAPLAGSNQQDFVRKKKNQGKI